MYMTSDALKMLMLQRCDEVIIDARAFIHLIPSDVAPSAISPLTS